MKIIPLLPRNKGISLVLTLAMVVIATILVTGFLVATRLDNTATSASAASLQAEEIASGAMEMLVDNLRREIEAGSTNATAIPLSAAKTVFLPSTNLTMVPRRLGFATNDLLANLVRISSSVDVPTNYPANIYNQALLRDRLAASPSTNALTTSPLSSKDGRYISTNRWLKPQLLPADAVFPPPSWVFVTRAGTKPSAADGDVGGSGGMADASISNQNTCIGRVAYAIYDAGGLLNVNLAGFPDSVTDARVSGGKNSAYWADLTQLGLTSTQANALVGWRNATSGVTASSFTNHVYGTGATNGFTKVRPGDNTLVSRQELIRYFQTQLAATNALPALGTFSYALNSPSYSAGTANAARYFLDYGLGKGPEPLRRFPLNTRLGLLDENDTTYEASILKYFGLSKGAGWTTPGFRFWTYPGTTISTVDQALAANREPNFFEILKTAILNGSLGTQAGFGARNKIDWEANNIDTNVIRIGANIIDQFDTDDFPTTIRFNNVDFYGIEDLPYFSEMFVQEVSSHGGSFIYTSGTTVVTKTYHYFELWNPHQAPLVTPAPGLRPTTLQIRADPVTPANPDYFSHGGFTPGLIFNYYSGPQPLAPWMARWWWPSTTLSQPIPWPTTPIDVDPATTDYRTTPRLVTTGTGNSHTLGGPINAFVMSGTWAIPTEPTREGTWVGLQAANYWHNTVFVLEYFDGSTAHPYATLSGLADGKGTGGIMYGNNGSTSWNNSPGLDFSGSDGLHPVASWSKPDPRTDRLGINGISNNDRAQITLRINQPMISATAPYSSGGFEVTSEQSTFSGSNRPGTLVTNRGTARATDNDNVTRPGDAFLNINEPTANPMILTGTAARPVILNRAFRSVGELGFVFRDQPWKTINFFSGDSADAALLDAFCLEESPVGESPIIAGQTSLNTQNKDVLRALISGAYSTPASTSAKLAANLDTTAAAFAAFSGTNPAFSPAGLVTGLMGSTTNSVTGAMDSTESPIKLRREAIVRALGSATQTRTWNLMIDLIAQSGKFPPNSTDLKNFVVQAERRYWLHLAIDRFTGEVIARQVETVQE